VKGDPALAAWQRVLLYIAWHSWRHLAGGGILWRCNLIWIIVYGLGLVVTFSMIFLALIYELQG
jgi:hypothetical protein